ncbi:MAG: ribosome maturation factor RimM [Peptococcaceae bacterium]
MMIKIGQIVTTHGHKGELKILPLTDNPERYKKLSEVYLQLPGGFTKMQIENSRLHKNSVIVKFKEITDMNTAEQYQHVYLCIEEDQLEELPEGHFYLYEIIGSEVYEGADYLGRVKDVIQTGSNDVYVVEKENVKDLLIPALKSIIKKIDVTKKMIDVKLPEGLID